MCAVYVARTRQLGPRLCRPAVASKSTGLKYGLRLMPALDMPLRIAVHRRLVFCPSSPSLPPWRLGVLCLRANVYVALILSCVMVVLSALAHCLSLQPDPCSFCWRCVPLSISFVARSCQFAVDIKSNLDCVLRFHDCGCVQRWYFNLTEKDMKGSSS